MPSMPRSNRGLRKPLRSSRDASVTVRALTDDELDQAAPFSLSYGAPVTAQFVIEDHALRHSGTTWQGFARHWVGDCNGARQTVTA